VPRERRVEERVDEEVADEAGPVAGEGPAERMGRRKPPPDGSAAALPVQQILAPLTERMLDLAGVDIGHRVLDVATGTGEQTLLAAQRVGPTGAVLATDIAARMLALADEAVAGGTSERADELGCHPMHAAQHRR
jgi:protein-L-isoaspartate O-methyltransferase